MEGVQPRILLMSTVAHYTKGRQGRRGRRGVKFCVYADVVDDTGDKMTERDRKGGALRVSLERPETGIRELCNTELCNLIHFLSSPLHVLVPTQPAALLESPGLDCP